MWEALFIYMTGNCRCKKAAPLPSHLGGEMANTCGGENTQGKGRKHWGAVTDPVLMLRHTHTHTHICSGTRTHAHTHAHTHKHTHKHTHTHRLKSPLYSYTLMTLMALMTWFEHYRPFYTCMTAASYSHHSCWSPCGLRLSGGEVSTSNRQLNNKIAPDSNGSTWPTAELDRSKVSTCAGIAGHFNEISNTLNICWARRGPMVANTESGDLLFAKRWMRPTQSCPKCNPWKKAPPTATKKHGSLRIGRRTVKQRASLRPPSGTRRQTSTYITRSWRRLIL